MLWSMEDSIAVLTELVRVLEEVLEKPENYVAQLSKSLGLAHRALDAIKAARQGEYHGKR